MMVLGAVEASANVRKRSLFSKRAKEVVGRRAKSITPKTNHKKKKVRIYKRYIQKKFSPSIMRDVIGNLSKSQVEWVKSTGFGELLHFRMEHYAHNLGYNIAESFDGKSCSVKLKAGVIKIDDRVVHSVMGLPIGDEIIICNEDSAVCDIWAEQFSGFVSSQISPLMVRDKILENRQADTNFKWNFLVMLYNFFIESNQNLFLKRDILRFSGNIENCGKYNWCQILVEKLKKTHTYWAANTKRHFAGPLAFLIYLYVCKIRNRDTVRVPTTYPAYRAYRAWSDMLIRERQKVDTEKKCFGEGILLKLRDGTNVRKQLQDSGQNIGLTMQDLVVIDNMENDNGTKDMTDIEEAYTMGSKKNVDMSGLGIDMVQNTQTRVELEIDKHYEEEVCLVKQLSVFLNLMRFKHMVTCNIFIFMFWQPYMTSFENNLKEFVDVYERCLNNCEVSLALFPQNLRLAKLKKEYSQYFKMFEATSPIAKKLLVGNVVHDAGKKSAILDNSDFVPSYSLGLSQLTPKNLLSDLKGIGNSQLQGSSGSVSLVGKGQPVPKVKVSHLCRSPYVSRVVDVSSHVITTEERNEWKWLFLNRRNKRDYLFEWEGRKCTKAHFQSLRDNKLVETTVIDTWTYLLNENEILKADSSPLRLFMTTETTYGPLRMDVGVGDDYSKMSRFAAFDDNMDLVIKMVNEMHNKQYDVKDFDMENQQALLKKLRMIYCHSLLTWSENTKKNGTLEGAANLAKGKILVA
ncbi:hypothetical protein AG4045_025685 [Apium graveolens]|uniref:Aminotransferase-like plant mobile domain-containing protein n=1 Tax=Apium graveolens TaxID=4045 RepID=A0A6L5B7N3_APIGR|nr:hypothetical protein AG4045_025685 [Apium graveolens]